jgi:hypothetical protein
MMCAMRRFSVAAVLLMLAACEPETPRRAASDAVVANVDDAGAAWPLLLQHCLNQPSCDPMSDFGTGVGEASGVAGSVAWHAQTREVVAEGAEDYGPRLVLALYGQRGTGGEAGRPLTIDELPDNLGGRKAKRSTLAIEYRSPSQAPEPYHLQFVSPFLTGVAAEVEEAKLEIIGQDGVLWTAMAAGMPPPPTPVNGRYTPPKMMVFHASRNLRDEALPALMAALARGDTLSVKLIDANGAVMLQDVLYTDGYGTAAGHAAASQDDPEIALPIVERCARFASEPDDFWKVANVTEALMVCDPRLPELRR